MKFCQRLALLLLYVTVTINIATGQNTNPVFYQIANKGERVYKITESNNGLQYELTSFKSKNSAYLLAYNNKTNKLLVVTNNKKLLYVSDEGEIEKSIDLDIPKSDFFVIANVDNNNNLYLSGQKMDNIYVVSLKNYSVKVLSNPPGFSIYDIAYFKNKKRFYSIDFNGALVSLNKKDFSLTKSIDLGLPNGCYGSIWSDGKNVLYAHHNETQSVYKINLKNNDVLNIGKAPFKGDYNDAATCFKPSSNKKNLIQKVFSKKNRDINTLPNTIDFKVYPNPSKGIFTVSSNSLLYNNLVIQIFNANGGLLYSTKFSGTKTLNLKELPAGNYILKVSNSQGAIKSEKIIIK